MRFTWRLIAALTLATITSAVFAGSEDPASEDPRLRQQLTVSMLDALNLYELGEHAQVTGALAQAKGGDAEALLALLKRDVPAWIASDGPAEVPRRRMIAAIFMLEVGNAAVDEQWELTRQITEWACELLRSSGPPTELERQWDLAALALLESNFQVRSITRPDLRGPAIRPHLGHIKQRFPEEPRLLLAEALVDEYDYWVGRFSALADATSANPMENEPLASGPMPALEKAAKVEANRPEANLRLGFLEYKRGRGDHALELLASAAAGSDDVTRVYLAHLFAAWTHEKAGHFDLATASYRNALSAMNGLSAALGLGVRLYAVDARDEADAIVAHALTDAVPDPFKAYGYGDFRQWPQLITRLRQEVMKR